MAIFNYTAAKGVFETADSNTTGEFNVSDVAVVGEAAPVGAINVQYLRFFDQGHAAGGGDAYASLDQLEFHISAEGTSTTFYLDTDNTNQSSSGGTQIALHTLTLATATPGDVAALVVTAINNALGTVHAVAQAQVGTSNTTDDFVDVYIYNRVPGANFALVSANETVLPKGVVQAATAPSSLRSIDGGAVLEASRIEDTVALDTGLGGIQLGALSDGTSVGQMICMFNNSSNLRMFFGGNFASGNDTCMIDHGEGSILAWNGTDWIEWKYYTGQASFT